jgi:outer membrane protein with beta-barrel domain
MKSALLVAAGVLGISTAASANTYLGLALGTEPGVNDLMANVATPSGRSLRGLGGIRFGNISIEGALNGFDTITNSGTQTVYQASAALKLSIPFGNNFEGFGRVGLERTWLNLDDPRYNLTGDGFLVGGGFEYRLNAILANASIFVDYTIHHTTLGDMQQSKLDSTSRIWGLGFTVGL